MPVSATNNTSPTPGIFTREQSTEERLESDRQQFLNLFLTQLQNQDPTSPLDSNQLTEQLVQFTSVEQQLESNRLLDRLVSAQAANANTAAVGYIGQNVIFNGNTTNLTGDGATWGYRLSEAASSVTINVFDEDGTLVHTSRGETTANTRHEFTWDGTGSNGERLPDGSYSVRISALDAENGTVETEIEATGTVTGVVTSGDTPGLLVGNVSVALDAVTRVAATA